MVSEKPLSRPTQFSGWLERRKVPRPRVRANMPSLTSGEMALRMVMRLTPKWRPSSASVINPPVLSINWPSRTWRRIDSRIWMCSGTDPASSGAAAERGAGFLWVRAVMRSKPLSCLGIEQVDILRARRLRNDVALLRHILVVDAPSHQRAGAVDIEHRGVAEVLDEIDLRPQSL